MVDFRMVEIDNINSPIKNLENETLWKLIMSTKTMSKERGFLAIEIL